MFSSRATVVAAAFLPGGFAMHHHFPLGRRKTLLPISNVLRIAATYLVICCLVVLCVAQDYDTRKREQAEEMLRDVAEDVKKHYYDPQVHGLDWDAKVRETKEKIDKAGSINQALTIIAALLDSLNDSHTFFLPPPRPYINDYGFQMQMIGSHCYIIRVRPGSDADTKGLRAGDEVVTVDGYTPTRDDFWRIEYLFNILRPQPGLHLALRNPDGSQKQVDINAKFRQLPPVKDVTGSRIFDVIRDSENEAHSVRVRYADRGNGLLIVKFPAFNLTITETDAVVGKMRKYDAVIFDLRGNPGGSVETLRFLLGGIFENKVKIGDRITRNSSVKAIETAGGRRGFTGKLCVLIDSQSASASELFARVVQIEKRGTVMGDHSSGAVMEALHYSHKIGIDTILFYGASVTEADLKMSDGQSLEHKGVTPDAVSLPTAADLAAGRDPILAQAAGALNVKISPEEAGSLFPYEWPKD
jgi:carboxyl-terminal processing protease